MEERKRGLDSLALSGRLRDTVRRSGYERRTSDFIRTGVISDVRRPTRPRPRSVHPVQSVTPVTAVQKPLPPRASLPIAKAISADIRAVPKTSRPNSTVLHTRVTSSRVLKRQIVDVPQIKNSKRKRSKQRKRLNTQNVLTLAAVVIIIGGLGIGLQGFWLNKEVATKTATLGSVVEPTGDGTNENSDVPSETPAGDPASYKVAADRPRTISIDKINVHARVLRLGIKGNNQLAAPANIFDAGWYDESSKPGEGGVVVIDGHVSGPTKHGVFYDLKKLVAGDQIKIERGDGKVFVYKVVRTASYAADKVDMTAVLTPVTKGKPGLNLITCSGEIDASRNHYKDRMVVFAEQVN